MSNYSGRRTGIVLLVGLLMLMYSRSTVNAETGKLQQRLQFDATDPAYFERRLNESVFIVYSLNFFLYAQQFDQPPYKLYIIIEQ